MRQRDPRGESVLGRRMENMRDLNARMADERTSHDDRASRVSYKAGLYSLMLSRISVFSLLIASCNYFGL